MTLAGFLLAGGAAAIFAGVQLWDSYLSPKAKTKRAVAATPRTLVRQIGGGLVRVTGRVHRHGELLRAPVSKRPCVAFDLDVQELDDERWMNRLVERRACTFA